MGSELLLMQPHGRLPRLQGAAQKLAAAALKLVARGLEGGGPFTLTLLSMGATGFRY
jgi:hypothetical protein